MGPYSGTRARAILDTLGVISWVGITRLRSRRCRAYSRMSSA